MKINIILTVILANLLSISSRAQDSILSIGGKIHIDNISYFNEQAGKINSRNEGLLRLEIGSARKEATQWKASTEVREDLADKGRNRVWIDELWVKHNLKHMDITFGKQIVEWGTADGINPTNNINPIDYSDLLDTENESIGVYAIRSQMFFGSFDIDLIWSPIPTVGILPSTRSRWFPTLSSMGIPMQLTDMDLGVEIQNQMPEMVAGNSEYGARIRKRFAGLDVGLSYFNGYEPLPELTIDTLIMQPSPMLVLKGMFYRHRVAGVEFAAALPSGFGLRGESAYFVPEKDKPERNSYIQSIMGIDRSFIFNSSSLFAIVQYIHDYRIDGAEYKTLDTRHIFRNSISTGVDLSFTNGFAAKLVSIVNLDSKDYLIRPELSYLTTKGIRLTARADIIEGNKNTFFGTYPNNSRIQCKVEYLF